MTTEIRKLPGYPELPVKAGAPEGSAWGLFGDDDQLGCLNLLTPERVVAAAELVRKGAVFPLNLRIDEPNPPLFGRGAPSVHPAGDGRGHRARRLHRQLLSAGLEPVGWLPPYPSPS